MIRTIGRIAFNLDTRRGTNLERPGDRHWMTKEQRISCNFQQLFFFFVFYAVLAICENGQDRSKARMSVTVSLVCLLEGCISVSCALMCIDHGLQYSFTPHKVTSRWKFSARQSRKLQRYVSLVTGFIILQP